ncbi:MAG TPA: GuaB3 family IMP dehydrogenase-related protein, partial [Armatimonadetes bacterium]|nr:GuaB3 family IMP dehydrogenase-related protein [Armatimonadota bacterium]
MEVQIGRGRKARMAYGFDDVALVPGAFTIDPEDVDVTLRIGDVTLTIPVLASAMDGAVNPQLAILMSELGGLAVLNLEGVQVRYEDPDAVIERIVTAPQDKVVEVLQEIYQAPIKHDLIAERVRVVRDAGERIGVACTPAMAMRLLPIAIEAGADVGVVQSTVTTARFVSSQHQS